MKAFLKIFFGGFVAFMIFAIAQEWDFFSTAWFGKQAPAPGLGQKERDAATRAVYTYLKMSCHYYGSAGDTRFGERMPVAPALLKEAAADVAYLKRNKRFQDPVLMKMEVGDTRLLSPGEVEIQTREFWIMPTLWLESGKPSDPPISEVVVCRYRVGLDAGEWKVRAWDFDDSEPETPPGAAAGPPPKGPPPEAPLPGKP